MSAGAQKEVYLFLDKHLKSEINMCCGYIHSIGQWETLETWKTLLWILFFFWYYEQKKPITSIAVLA